MGAGKSGSTILGVTLGNCEDMFLAGELYHWLISAGVPVIRDPERMQFWNSVGEEVEGATPLFGTDVLRYIERSLCLFRVRGWPLRRRLRPLYRRVVEELYRAIARQAGVTHVVDTSHFPMRASELQRIAGIDMYLLFLTRDPRNILASYTRHVSDSRVRHRLLAMRTNAELWWTYLLSVVVFLRHRRDRRFVVRHEEFIENPEGVLRDILERVDSAAAVPDLSSLSTGLPIQGNQLLKSDVVALRGYADPPPPGWRMTQLVQLPWTAVVSRLRPRASAARLTLTESDGHTSTRA